MAETKKKHNTFQRIFFTGLIFLIPVALTAGILVFLFNLLDNWLAPVVNQLLHVIGVPLPLGWSRIPGLGILATLALVFFTGLVGSHYLGRRLLGFGHGLLQNIPLVKNVYGGISQLVKVLTSAEATPFRTVVMLEFPRPGVWTLGFVSNDASELVNSMAGTRLVNVFLPAAPIPTQGLYLMVPKKDLRVLAISTEEGFKMLATLGLVQNAAPAAALPPGRSPETRAGRRPRRRRA